MRARGRDDDAWRATTQSALTAAVTENSQRLTATVESLNGFDPAVASLADSLSAFELTRVLQESWRRSTPYPELFPLAGVVWRDGLRLGWSEDAWPSPWENPPASETRVQRTRRGVVLQRFVPVMADSAAEASVWIELQVGLRGPLIEPGPAGRLERSLLVSEGGREWRGEVQADEFRAKDVRVTWELVSGPLRPRAWNWGQPQRGLHAARDVSLGRDAAGTTVGMRVTATAMPRSALARRDAANRLVALVSFWFVALILAAVRRWGFGGGVAAAWAGRILMAAIDFFHWIQPATLSSIPTGLSEQIFSLTDPAYFATPFGFGWLASSADALVSAALLAITSAGIMRALGRSRLDAIGGDDRRDRGADRRHTWISGILFGVAVALGLLLLRKVTFELVDNANPRLIGPQIPYRSLAFWFLHAALFVASGALVGSFTVLVGWWRERSLPRTGRGATLAAGVAGAVTGGIVLAMVGESAAWWSVGIGAGVAAAAVWWLAPLVRREPGLAGQLALVGVFLLAASWNYMVLRDGYGRNERVWLQRKAEQVVRPQSDWITFLLQDALQEMAATAGEITPAAGDARSGGLWRNEPAYRLWLGSSFRDLGLPCLIEIDSAQRRPSSLFAVGFLRDFGYEVQARSSWSEPTSFLAEGSDVLVQTERRRYATGEEIILRGEVPRDDGEGWIRVELPLRSRRAGTLLERLEGARPDPAGAGYRPRAEIDQPLLLVHGDRSGWLDAGEGVFPDPGTEGVVADLQDGRRSWGVVEAEGTRYLCLWARLPDEVAERSGEGFLIGLQRPGWLAVALDLSRLVLLDALLLATIIGLVMLPRGLRGSGRRWQPSFQQRFLLGYLFLGALLLALAGTFVDRLTRERVVAEARRETRNGLAGAMGQLQGMLAEQARGLASSDYIADLLEGRLSGQRPVGPFSVQQGMVFAADGSLLLDETLSDLAADEAFELLATARRSPLVVVGGSVELYLGTLIPIDLSGVLSGTTADPDTGAVDSASGHGFFFYRQRVDEDLLVGLAEVIQGEVTLRHDGEIVLASHPARVFSGEVTLLTPPTSMLRLLEHPSSPQVELIPGSRLAFAGEVALPSLLLPADGRPLRERPLPAVLSVGFPDRQREVVVQRERTVLYLAGLATLVLLTALLLVMVMTWNIFGPVRVLVTATQRLAGGDFAAPLPAAGRDEVGRLSGAFARMRDELRGARHRLEARERFLATVLERVPVGVVVCRPDGEVAALNPAGREILAAFYHDLPEREAASRLLADHRAARAAAAGSAAASTDEGGEAEWSRADGRRTVRGRVATLDRPDGRSDTMAVFEDVTEFLANKRLALNAEMARQVAHEIKNPLTPIQLSVQLLNQAYRDGAENFDVIMGDAVERILEQVELLRSIAGEFSLLGRPGDLETEALDLPALVRHVTDGYAVGDGASSGATRVTVRDEEGPPPVLGHRDSLRKILGNLMQNSLDARGKSGDLEVEIAFRVTADQVVMAWSDNGSGLAADVADRLFDPYFSTKSQGTGLGLAICRNLMGKMGGSITLANRRDGRGAVAEVTLLRAG